MSNVDLEEVQRRACVGTPGCWRDVLVARIAELEHQDRLREQSLGDALTRCANYVGRIAELEAKCEGYRKHTSPTADAEWDVMEKHIAELEAVVAEVRRLRQEFVNSAGTTVSFGPLWRALDTLENPSSHEYDRGE